MSFDPECLWLTCAIIFLRLQARPDVPLRRL